MHKRTRPLLTSPPKGGGGSTGRTAKSASTGNLPFFDEEFLPSRTAEAKANIPGHGINSGLHFWQFSEIQFLRR